MTYHNSIALAKICLAPIDEETSSAAQEMASDAGRQWKRGLSCVLQTIKAAHIGKYGLLTIERRHKCHGLCNDQACMKFANQRKPNTASDAVLSEYCEMIQLAVNKDDLAYS